MPGLPSGIRVSSTFYDENVFYGENVDGRERPGRHGHAIRDAKAL
jgi:hypothetical protein